ncbi:hypothetical protein K3553_02645 [Leisingera aquaemixtae]|uniref:hypothetical protein n=1 Tax=Leisingera aquaemixtae TaxID=1396826 RepID=UPI0021A3469D|nr:hypothetical protein [Leisingera aquaemixtae]UWQ25384.1 hypothetical protein K3553_02645 [Leisingera aquaemixtae]
MRLAAAINEDQLAIQTVLAWGSTGRVIDDGTLTRWHEGGVDTVVRARSFKKQAIFEFFERNLNPRTGIYRPADGLPRGLGSFAVQFGDRIREPFTKDLSPFDGNYRVFRPAWTIPELSHKRVLISRLSIQTDGGFTRFVEMQKYDDPDSPDIRVDQTDDGAVLSMGENVVFLGIGKDGHGCKLYAAWDYYPLPSKGVAVDQLKGDMMGINGNGPHPSYPFIAIRTTDAVDKINTEIVPPSDTRVTTRIRLALGMAHGL